MRKERPQKQENGFMWDVAKTFVNWPSIFLNAKFILRCQNMFYKGEGRGLISFITFDFVHFGEKTGSFENLGSGGGGGGSPIPESKCNNIGKILTFW